MCIRRSTPAVSVEYYPPWWINIGAVHVNFTYGASPRVALSFPMIRPPDADFFVYIRTGQSERIKELFTEGRASVADIVAPYGLSPLLLAIVYNQMHVYRLLISAGAYRITPVASHAGGIDLWRFWDVFSSWEYSLSATEIVWDYVNLSSLEPQAKALSRISTELSLEEHDFTRLHKAVLRLTAEPFDSVLRTSKASIDSRDSLGRTALHLAAYNRDANDIDILLRHGANPDLGDRHGKTPLHVAGALGSASCANALIAGGANLESTDQFGDTTLHHACMQGHVHIVELLLEAGADTEAQNYVGETPLRHAIFSDHILVVQLLHERGAAFALQDKWGSTALHNAIMFNSHRVLSFLLAIKMRTDQNYYSGRTVLHILGESANLRTLEICQNARLKGIDVAAVNAQGFSALDCLRQRRDAGPLIEPFGALLMSMSASANELGERFSLTFDVVEDTSEERDSVEDFVDAMEVQPVA
jgi:ankyrin repeat protein